jgi:hypothetical protein
MGWFGGFVMGILAAWVLAVWLIRSRRDIACKVGLVRTGTTGTIEYQEEEGAVGPAAVPPDVLPTSTTNEEIVERGEDVIKEHDREDLKHLIRLIRLLPKWHPQNHWEEKGYQRSFYRFLRSNGYDDRDIAKEKSISPRGDDPRPGERRAKPDFIIKKNVLVEIKKEFDITSTTDRAVGQVGRYIHYWRTTGPTLLLVCSEYDNHLRSVVDAQIERWKSRDIPVMAHYVRSPNPDDGE